MISLTIHRVSSIEHHLMRGTILLARIEECTDGQWVVLDQAERKHLIAHPFETASEAEEAARHMFEDHA